MAHKGRPSKPGKRHPNGKKVQKTKPVDPTAKVSRAKRRFGSYYATALGRMFAAGFMGEPDVAKGRYQGAQRFARVYGAVYGGPYFRCPLDQAPRGGSGCGDDHFAEHNREWMRAAMTALDASGCYPYLEQVLSINAVDEGPSWLDRMLAVQRWNQELSGLNTQLRDKARQQDKPFVALAKKEIDPRDQMVADAVIRALDVLAPPVKAQGILVAFYDDAA